MQIKRTVLLDKLNEVAPALSDHNLIPILTHFWFTGESVLAYNDQIAISVPLKADFKGACPGSTLLDLLKASRAAEVTLTAEGETLNVKMGKSKIKLGLLPNSDFIFEMPPLQKDSVIKNSKPFIEGIAGCMPSVGTDMTVPDLAGVSIIPNANGLHFYGCNNATLSHVRVKGMKIKNRLILSAPFCNQFLRLTEKKDDEGNKKPWSMQLTEDHAKVQVDDIHLFGRLLFTDAPQDFDSILKENYPEGEKRPKMTAIEDKLRKRLQLALDRAMIIARSKLEPTQTKITIVDGRIKFYSRSELGEITDNVDIKHPDATIAIEAKLLKPGIDMADKMLITDRCAVMTKNDLLYLVCAYAEN